MLQHLPRLLPWVVCLAVLIGLGALAHLTQKYLHDRRAAETAEANPETSRRAVNNVIKLGAEFAESHGIKDEPAGTTSWVKRATAYGRIVVNPRSVTEVRVGFAGTLRADSERGWPGLGDRVKAGQVLGWLDVRVGPQERLDLATRLGEARLKQKGAEELLRVQEERYDRLKGAGTGVSRSELDTALTQLTEARTQLETARAAARLWQQAQDAIEGRKEKMWSQPLTAPAAGEITELTSRPGMAVEPGSVIARLVDFRLALVRLEIPPEALGQGPPSEVELFARAPVPPALQGSSNRHDPGRPIQFLTGRLLGTAPQVEVNSQFAACWYEVDTDFGRGDKSGSTFWRPGLFVMALVKVTDDPPHAAVSVPETSLLYHQGRALVYVRIGAGRYERREVQVLGRQQGRWVLASGVTAGEPVVFQRAQVLLSEEFLSKADDD
jgi:multidrug efflux pump subunit AcrA (membrane-fusion protein)